MKKILSVCAAFLLPCCLLFSQEAESSGAGAELSIVPRLDLGVCGPVGNNDGKVEPTLGNSSIYTLFEGNITEHISFYLENHWASFGLVDKKWDKYAYTDLYDHTGHSDWDNWLNAAYLQYDFDSGFWANLGKSILYMGGMEFDEYDVLVHPMMASTLWNNFQPFQWQVSAGWTNESGNTTLGLQMSTSPYGEHPFSSGLYSYAAQWRGEYGPLANIWSFAMVGKGDGEYYPLLSLGQRFSIGESLSISLDYSNAVSLDVLDKGHYAYAGISWKPVESIEVIGRAGMESSKFYEGWGDRTRWNFGGGVHWFPLKDSEALRIHATFSRNGNYDCWEALAGAVYHFSFSLFGN